jgi:hypothetical protein
MDIVFGAITKEERETEIARQQALLDVADKEKVSVKHAEHV